MMRRTPSSTAGFTLLEVLLALMIFVGSVAVLSQLVGLGTDNAELARNYAEGMLLIENRFAAIDAKLEEPSSTEGATDDFFPRWQWSMSVENAGDFLYRITVSAHHETGTNVSMTRLFFDSTEAEESLSQAQSSSTSGSASTSGASQ